MNPANPNNSNTDNRDRSLTTSSDPLNPSAAGNTTPEDEDHLNGDYSAFNLSSDGSISIGERLKYRFTRTTIACPSCGHRIPPDDQYQDQGQDDSGNKVAINELRGLPAGVKFDPTDIEIIEHLKAKMTSDSSKIHPLIDEFIPTLEGDDGICCTHPEKLPGVSKGGQVRHFFHRTSKAYTTGTRKRRKVLPNYEEEGSTASETRWHKTGKTRPVVSNGAVKGFKKILVLYANYGRHRKPAKTNWVMHQYHLGDTEEEKDGELLVSKVFYQTQPRQCAHNNTNNNDDVAIKEPVHDQQQQQQQPRLHRQELQQQLLFLQQRDTATLVASSTAGYYDQYQPFGSYHNHQHRHAVGSGDQHNHHQNSSEILPHDLIPNLGLMQGEHGSSLFALGGGMNTNQNN